MTPAVRIQAIRLMECINKNPDFAKKLGIEVDWETLRIPYNILKWHKGAERPILRGFSAPLLIKLSKTGLYYRKTFVSTTFFSSNR